MKVREMIGLLQRKSAEHGIGEYECMWTNLNIQEDVEIEELEIDPGSKTVLFR